MGEVRIRNTTQDESESKKREVRARIEQSKNLPTLPDVVVRIVEMVDSPQTTGRELAAEIAKDQVVFAKVLKLVNSGFYGFSQPISTIPHAVTMLGFDAVKSLILSSSVLETMDQALPGLWRHSLACARTSTFIAEHLDLAEPEEIGVVGLLHDLGKVILYQTLEVEFGQVSRRVDKKDMLFYLAEKEVMGCHHADIAGWLLEKWALPAKVIEPIADHHDFRPNRDHAQRTAIVHFADVLARAEGFGSGADRKIPRLDPRALETLSMTVDDAKAIMNRMNAELADAI